MSDQPEKEAELRPWDNVPQFSERLSALLVLENLCNFETTPPMLDLVSEVVDHKIIEVTREIERRSRYIRKRDARTETGDRIDEIQLLIGILVELLRLDTTLRQVWRSLHRAEPES